MIWRKAISIDFCLAIALLVLGRIGAAVAVTWQQIVSGRAYRTSTGDIWHVTAISANGDVVFHAASDVEPRRMDGDDFAAAVEEILDLES